MAEEYTNDLLADLVMTGLICVEGCHCRDCDAKREAARRLRAMPDDPLTEREAILVASLLHISDRYMMGRLLHTALGNDGTYMIASMTSEPSVPLRFTVPSRHQPDQYRACVAWVREHRADLQKGTH